MGSLSNPIDPGAKLVVAETEVFAVAAAPTSFTDLDLSAVVGAKFALVLLKINRDGATGRDYGFRRNGETEFDAVSYIMGAFACNSGGTYKFGMVLVYTDAAGIVEWMSDSTDAVTVDVIAYVS